MIQEIELSKLKIHPRNVRKDYNDIDELADSIKAQGILQNLTIVPDSSEEGMYLVVVGNRRLTAARKAGLTSAPCSIVEMSERDQVSTMLLENIQRNDLSICEQAQGFQMMLDLGETEDSIAQKTGFSKTTVRHRLNIAKLDQKVLKKKEEDGGFQLTLKDLYELEKVENVKTRDKILKEATSSRDLVWKAQSAVSEANREKKTKQITELLKKAGVKKAPKQAENEQYSGKWQVIKEYDLDKDVPKRIKLPKSDDDIYYLRYYRTVRVIKERKKNDRNKQLSPEEQKRKQRDKHKKEIRTKIRALDARRKEFVENIISGKIEAIKDDNIIYKQIWDVLIELSVYMNQSSLRRFFTAKADYDCTEQEKDEAQKKIASLSFIHSMLVMMNYAIENAGDIYDWQGFYRPTIGNAMKQAYGILKLYGWSFADNEEEQIINGTHEFYEKSEEEANG